MAEHLDGGRHTIIREGDMVYRPYQVWTNKVHDFLRYLHHKGFYKVPFPHGINGCGQEMVSYLKGDVFNDILPERVRSDETLIEFAEFIRDFHDLGAEYIEGLTGNEQWMLPVQTKIETMCHGDLAPYNTAFEGKHVAGLIDFDTLHPGSRLWDLSYALYRWIPLMSEDNPENFGSRLDKTRRLKLFLEAYGQESLEWDDVFDWVIKRLIFLVQFMKQASDDGDETFKQNIQEGHLKTYLEDMDYIRENWIAK